MGIACYPGPLTEWHIYGDCGYLVYSNMLWAADELQHTVVHMWRWLQINKAAVTLATYEHISEAAQEMDLAAIYMGHPGTVPDKVLNT